MYLTHKMVRDLFHNEFVFQLCSYAGYAKDQIMVKIDTDTPNMHIRTGQGEWHV